MRKCKCGDGTGLANQQSAMRNLHATDVEYLSIFLHKLNIELIVCISDLIRDEAGFLTRMDPVDFSKVEIDSI